MLARDFAAVLGELEPHLPLSDLLEKMDRQQSGRWWFSQRTHLVGYILRRAYENNGWDSLEISQVWGGITRPEARLWVIEALGLIGSEGREVVDTLVELPLGQRRNKYRAHRDYLEQHYPLETIIAAAEAVYEKLQTTDIRRYEN